MVSDVLRLGVLASLVAVGCLPDNPSGPLTTESETSDGSATDGDTDTSGAQAGLLGCPAGETCTLVLVSETLDDRVEVFEPLGSPAYRGTIRIDLKPGSESGDGTLDEPFGLALVGEYLHVIAGHYPQRESGSMLSFSRSWLAGFEAGTEIATDQYFTGSFIPEVLYTPLQELEPIFLLQDPVGTGENTRLLVSVFNNDLFSPDDQWTQVGKLAVIDASDPSNFGFRDLTLQNGDCLGASELVLLEGTQAAVACDGNDSIALLNLDGVDTGEPEAAAAAITGEICEIPGGAQSRRVRYLAPAGAGGVVAQYGPTPTTSDLSGDIYLIGPACSSFSSVTIGEGGTAWTGELAQFDPTHWLVTSGGQGANAERGVYVLRGAGSSLEVCGTVAGFDWAPAGGEGSQQLSPFGLAVAPDGQHIAVGAAPFFSENDDGMLGKVLWAELSGTDDPCTMTATVTDLTDGGAGHAPQSNPNDDNTWRRGPNVVVIEEVSG